MICTGKTKCTSEKGLFPELGGCSPLARLTPLPLLSPAHMPMLFIPCEDQLRTLRTNLKPLSAWSIDHTELSEAVLGHNLV